MQVVMRRLPSSRLAQRAANSMASLASGAEPSVTHLQASCATLSTSAAVALAIFVGCGARVIPALLAISVQRDLNWPESYVIGPVALAVAVSALGAPLAARGLLHVGARSLLFVSLLALSASLALSSFATSAWHLLLFWGIGVGLSGSLSAFVLAAMIGFREHVRHCGTSFGLFTSIQCLGSATGLLLASRATEAFGWHVVVKAGAAITLAAAFVVVLMIRPGRGQAWRESSTFDRPSYIGVRPRRWAIWRIAAIFFICGASTTGLIDSRLAMLCMGNGLGLTSSADVLAILAICGGIGSAVSGALADRYPARILLILYFAVRALALLWLPLSSFSVGELSAFGALFGLDAALTFPALAKLLSRSLDQYTMVAMMSWMMIAHIFGAAITSAWVGFVGMAGYPVSFTVVGLMCLIAAGLAGASQD